MKRILVWLFLPLMACASNASPSQKTPAAAREASPPERQAPPKLVLVMDDDKWLIGEESLSIYDVQQRFSAFAKNNASGRVVMRVAPYMQEFVAEFTAYANDAGLNDVVVEQIEGTPRAAPELVIDLRNDDIVMWGRSVDFSDVEERLHRTKPDTKVVLLVGDAPEDKVAELVSLVEMFELAVEKRDAK